MRTFRFGILACLVLIGACGKKDGAAPDANLGGEANCTYVSGPNFVNHKACYEVKRAAVGDVPVYQGDIKLARSVMEAKARQAMRGARGATSLSSGYVDYFWPGNQIPYTIESGVSASAVNNALADLGARTGLNFVQRTNQEDYIAFVGVETDDFCGLSFVGKVGGKQEIEINVDSDYNCQTRRVIQHEVLHALGFWHEQSRPDRDDFVRILWQNVIPGAEPQFDKLPTLADGVGPYDFGSVMHYRRDAFSRNGADTIQANTVANNALIGSATQASAQDVAAVKSIYGTGTEIVVEDEPGAKFEREADIAYTTSTAVPSRIRFGTSRDDLNRNQEVAGNRTSHAIRLENLEPKTRYFYQVLTGMNGSTEVWTLTRSFVTDVVPPELIEPRVAGLQGSVLDFRFSTNENTEGLLYFCGDRACNDFLGSVLDLTFGKIHQFSVRLGDGLYYVYAYAEDEAGNGVFSDAFEVENDGNPPVISGVAVSNRTSSGATITWSTNEPATSRVLYGTSASSLTPVGPSGTRTSHSVPLTGLAANTTYFFKVQSADASGNVSTSGLLSFSTDVSAPTISNVVVSNIQHNQATVSWTTSEEADSKVLFGTSCSNLDRNVAATPKVTSHSLNLTGLTASTSYCFKVVSRDAAGNEAQSGTSTFTTPSLNDTVTLQVYNDSYYTWLPRWVYATSSQPQNGATTLTMKVVGRYSGQVFYTTSMVYQGSQYFAEIPSANMAQAIVYGNAYVEVVSSKGGTAKYPY